MKKNKKTIKIILLLTLLLPEIAHATEYVVCGADKKIPLVLASLISTVMTIIKIIIPILIVISGMISFLKVTYSSNVEDEMKKAQSKLINSVIAAVIIFFVISIINFGVSLVAGANNNVMSCVNCLINPKKCEQIDETGTKRCPGFITDDYDENCNPINKSTNESTETNTNSNTNSNSNNNTGTNNNTNSNTNNNTGTNNNTSANNNTNNKRTDIKEINGATYIKGILIVNKTYGISESYAPNNKNIYGECTGESCFTSQTWKAYQSMMNNAKYDGIYLEIGSGYRSYAFQNDIYNNYVNAGRADVDTFSARPGHSEHQTGLAMDVCKVGDSETCINDKFAATAEAIWLNDNCYKYGFIIRYPEGKADKTGYKYEPWHLRYVGKDLAKKLYNNGNWITLEEYLIITSSYN